jgi:hypothetical protein
VTRSIARGVWREIATWYGWSALTLFPEEASAFSPEDLYSNLPDIKLAGSFVCQYAVTSMRSPARPRAMRTWGARYA